MKNHFQHMKSYLDHIDEDSDRAVQFMSLENKMDRIVRNLLAASIVKYELLQADAEIEKRIRIITEYLDSHFYNFTWPLHDCHFHTNFETYINCPFTCAAEISECLNKISKEYFNA